MHRTSVPGPAPYPGLGPSYNVLRFVRDPVGHVGDLFAKHGSIVQLVQGGSRSIVSSEFKVPGTVFVRGPELNRELRSDHDRWHKTSPSGALYPQSPVSERTRPLSRMLTGLFHVNVDEHRHQRRILLPAFHRSRIASYRDEMVELTEALAQSLVAGEVRDLRADMTELTLKIATKTLFGADLGEQGTRVGRDLQRWLGLLKPAAIAPFDLPGLPYRRFLDLATSIDSAIVALVAQRRDLGTGGDDMLSMLLSARDETGAGLKENQIIGHASTIFLAGHETSANALCWVLFLLSQHAAVMGALFDELWTTLSGAAPTVEQLPQLPLLERVIKEGLRLFPPVPLNHRVAAEDTDLGGHALPAGTEVMSSIYHTHRLPELFEQPLRFDPKRWETTELDAYSYNPFSAGPRMCIGSTFAMMEIKIALSILLQRFRFELAPDTRVDRQVSITLTPKHGLSMRIHAQDRRFVENARRVRGDVHEMVELGHP